MGRIIKDKELINTRLATKYGGWMYCTNCNKNIGYLCYVTYDRINFNYVCNCGSEGSVILDFEDSKKGTSCNNKIITIKNRFCCPEDESPLITILSNSIKNYKLEITCKSCNKIYMEQKNSN